MAADDPLELSFDALVDPHFDDGSLAGAAAPHAQLLLLDPSAPSGGIQQHPQARGHVRLDAGALFVRLYQGQQCAFPGPLQELLAIVGSYVAARAVRERRHVALELSVGDEAAIRALVDSLVAAGYRVDTADVASTSAADSTAVLASEAGPHQHAWLLQACQAWLHEHGQ